MRTQSKAIDEQDSCILISGIRYCGTITYRDAMDDLPFARLLWRLRKGQLLEHRTGPRPLPQIRPKTTAANRSVPKAPSPPLPPTPYPPHSTSSFPTEVGWGPRRKAPGSSGG